MKQKLLDSAGKSYRNDRIIEVYMDQLNILAELDSLSPHYGTHTCTLSLSPAHTHMDAKTLHKVFHAVNCQFDRSKLSSTPYFPSNEKQAWSSSLSHAHTPTHTSRLDGRRAYMLQYIKRDRLDQRLNIGPVEICTCARIDSIVTIHGWHSHNGTTSGEHSPVFNINTYDVKLGKPK